MNYCTFILSFVLLVSLGAFTGKALAAEENKPSQTITRAGTQESITGSAEYFTGTVRHSPVPM